MLQEKYVASQVPLVEKNPPANAGDIRDDPWDHPLEEGVVTHSSILAWRIPWTEELGGIQSLRVTNWSDLVCAQ